MISLHFSLLNTRTGQCAELCRFLHLDGLNPEQMSMVEAHCLSRQWALNKQINGDQRHAVKLQHGTD